MRTLLTQAVLAGLLLAVLALPTLAGGAGGPVHHTATVQGFQTKTVRLTFVPGRPAVVRLKGDGDTPLGLIVQDAHGRQVARVGRDPDHQPTVRWTPTSAGPYLIKIVNRGGVPARVLLRTN